MIKTCLIVRLFTLPPDLQQEIREWHGFGHDIFLSPPSEFRGCWNDLNHDAIKDYHTAQCDKNNYEGHLEDFIKDYGLHLEVYLIENHSDALADIDAVLIET